MLMVGETKKYDFFGFGFFFEYFWKVNSNANGVHETKITASGHLDFFVQLIKIFIYCNNNNRMWIFLSYRCASKD